MPLETPKLEPAATVPPAEPGRTKSALRRFGFGPDSMLHRLGTAIESRPRALFWFIAMVLAVQIGPWLYGSEDATFYMSAARNIAHEGRMATFDNPSMKVLPAYPVVIAPAFILSDRPFLLISIEHWLLAILAAVGIYLWARRVCPEAAVLITVLALLNATFTYFYRRPLKEVAYLAALIWLVNVLHWLVDTVDRRKTIGLSLAATCLLAFAALIRYSALAVLPVFCLFLAYLAWRRQISWRRAAFVSVLVAGPATLAALGYLVHEEAVARNRTDGTYLRAMQAAIDNPQLTGMEVSSGNNRYWIGFKLKLAEIWRAVVPGAFKDSGDIGPSITVATVVRFGFAILMAVGWWRMQRRRVDLLALMFPCYLIVYLPLACDQGARLMIPYLPVLMACLWFACEGRKWRTAAITAVAVAQLAIAIGYWAAIDAPMAMRANQKWDAMQQIADSLPEDRDLVGMPNRDRSRFCLEFLLDRQVAPISDIKNWKDKPGRCEWLILPENFALEATDRVHGEVPGYVVLDIGERIAPAAATAPELSSRPETGTVER